MLYAFAFDRLAALTGDLYFLNPHPTPGEEGPEQGVRLELRIVEKQPLNGSIYSAQPIAVTRPIWRADLLESVDAPGTLDRAHHHPRFRGWEPGRRHFVEALSSDPLPWVESRLRDVSTVLAEAEVDPADLAPGDPDALVSAVPDIMNALERLLDGVRAGRLGQPPADGVFDDSARVGWL